jgi:hypothetical protein
MESLKEIYAWPKKIVQWKSDGTVYLSVPFTWMLDEAKEYAKSVPFEVKIGGPALMERNECEGFEPLKLHNQFATFTTRGCPNRCEFCAVPVLEGDLKEIKDFRPAPIICDNNFLAASISHIKRVVDAIKKYAFVDFNQGLEARRFTPEKAEILSHLKCKVRFSFDHVNCESMVKDAVGLCREKTTKDIGVYVLIGFDDTPDDAHYRLEKVRSWGVRPNPMRYQPLNAKKKNEYISENWTEVELKRTMRYYSRLNWLSKIPYDEFNYLRA